MIYVACERCGCRMITKASQAKGLLICVDCGHRLAQVQQRQTLGSWFAASFLLLFLMVLVVITARLEPTASSDLELEPIKERSRGE
jgi:hypothetical protein